MKRRPLGVTLISLLNIILPVLSIIGSLVMYKTLVGKCTGIELILFYILLCIAITVGVGLWLLCNWARYLFILHLILNIIAFILHKQSPFNLSIIFEVAIICYLFLYPKSKEAFAELGK